MASVINLHARTGATYAGDDAQPTLTMSNSSTGPGFSVDKLLVTSNATITEVNGQPLVRGAATEGVPVTFGRTVLSSPTVAVAALNLNSTASAPVFELQNQGFVSCTTILFTTGGVAGTGAFRVKYGNNYGWIPVMPDGAVTAAPRG